MPFCFIFVAKGQFIEASRLVVGTYTKKIPYFKQSNKLVNRTIRYTVVKGKHATVDIITLSRQD